MVLHPDFKPATWRGTTGVAETIGISFDLVGGNGIVRLKLDARSARNVAETLLEYVDRAKPKKETS